MAQSVALLLRLAGPWFDVAPIVKNKLFFFGDYQGTRQVAGVSSGLIPVPSSLEKTGDFSDLGTTGFGLFTGSVRGGNSPTNFPAVLSQRLGYMVTAGEPYWFSGCTTSAQCVFPGAVRASNKTLPEQKSRPERCLYPLIPSR